MCFSRIIIILAMWLNNESMGYDTMIILRTNQLVSFVLYNSNSKYCYSLDKDLAYEPVVKFIATPGKKVTRLLYKYALY